MSGIKVLAGDFRKHGVSAFHGKSFALTPSNQTSPKSYNASYDVKSIELADEKAGVKVFGAAAWGTLGAIALGPVGLLAGAVLGGRGQTSTFIAEFSDGRKLMGQCSKECWLKIVAARF